MLGIPSTGALDSAGWKLSDLRVDGISQFGRQTALVTIPVRAQRFGTLVRKPEATLWRPSLVSNGDERTINSDGVAKKHYLAVRPDNPD